MIYKNMVKYVIALKTKTTKKAINSSKLFMESENRSVSLINLPSFA